ncbi:MAG: DUF3463 domain-containing protein, partial [Proteobacteria bacterium]|nr:DUF3463 domain-containing protein [Pseudomonadota bacterium]
SNSSYKITSSPLLSFNWLICLYLFGILLLFEIAVFISICYPYLLMSFWVFYFFRYFLECRLLGKRKPILGGFKITHKCNLRCYHCPFWEKETGELDFNKAKEVLDKMYKLGVRIVIFEGGEPLLWKDGDKNLIDLINYAKKTFFSIGVTTNGTLPLKDIPSDVLWVSFDGMRETYKKIRGDVFDKVIRNIKESNHKNLYANVTINKLNEGEIEEIVKFLSELVKGITIQFHYPYGAEEDRELFIPLKERVNILDRLIRLKKDGYPVMDTVRTLNAMKTNSWKCHDWMIANANPDGTITEGCYIKNRGEINCRYCGFAAHTELSLAFDFYIPAINMGRKIFRYRVV